MVTPVFLLPVHVTAGLVAPGVEVPVNRRGLVSVAVPEHGIGNVCPRIQHVFHRPVEYLVIMHRAERRFECLQILRIEIGDGRIGQADIGRDMAGKGEARCLLRLYRR